jgi:DNA polymerase III subunit delta'
MGVFDELVGQEAAITQIREAAIPDSSSMTHAWLIVGPAGSGRSTLARAFAETLVTRGSPQPELSAQVMAGSHPDVTILATEKVTIAIDEVRQLVTQSYFSPSVSPYRVIIIEDADRMTERTSNVLLKALEEPPPRTVWVLCAPSIQDVLPTIRSRTRVVTLTTPTAEEVADLICRRESVDPDRALMAAREAQSHVGMAMRLATDDEVWARRDETVRAVLEVASVSQAVATATRLVEIAGEDQKALLEKLDQQERDAQLRSMGIEPGGTIPPSLRAGVKELEENQKRRHTRALRDGVDRILTDISSALRDVLMVSLGSGQDLVNERFRAAIEHRATQVSAADVLWWLDEVSQARDRIESNTPPVLALEAMLIAFSGRIPTPDHQGVPW